jgi:hypothetical protein
MLNHKTFTVGMVKLSEFFRKDVNLSESFLEDYYMSVKELNDTQFERAVKHLIKTHDSHFFPIPAELFKAVEESREQIQVTPESNQIEPNYVPCPPELKEKIRDLLKNRKGKYESNKNA